MTSMTLILFALAILLVVGGLPTWKLHHYGYGPSGIGGVALIILSIALLAGAL
jgi:Protein of unknown function (DUF3309)